MGKNQVETVLKVKLIENLNELDRVDYIKWLELEEDKIYNVTNYNNIYYAISDEIKKGLWIEKRVCTIVE